MVGRESRESGMRSLVMEMDSALGTGSSLTEIVMRHPRIFSDEYVSMVAAGESGGKLPTVLERLAVEMERSYQLRKKVMAALYYPAFVVCFAILMVGALLTFGVPRFEAIYAGFGGKLPALTCFFVGLGHFLATDWKYAPLVLLAAVPVVRFVGATPAGRWAWDSFRLTAWPTGPLFQQLAIAHFARTLNVLHTSGVSVMESLELVARSMDNVVMENVVKSALRNVMEGDSIAGPLRRSGWFTEMAVSMVAAGEQSGTLDVMLDQIADFYEKQVHVTLQALTSLVEPVLMVGVGVSVGTIVVAMALPIFNLAALMMQ